MRSRQLGALRRTRMRLITGLLCLTATMAAWGRPVPATSPLDPVVHALCGKDVVLLGEDANHAGATTLAVKSRLVEQLVTRCGFRGVVFESQFYDMLDVQHGLADGSATRDQLADAIGALWSRYPAFAPLVDWLFREARAGHVFVAGMDPQVGGITAHYAQQRLPDVLSAVLPEGRRDACGRAIGRHDRWTYDDAHPFDARALDELRGCLHDIDAAMNAQGSHASPDLRAMAASYASYLAFAQGDGHGLRDRAMFDNLERVRSRWPAGTRFIVWCASVHAAKSLEGARPGVRPLGSYVHEAFGTRAAAIGFSALGGRYGHVGGHGPARAVPAAAANSLEARAFAGAGPASLRYVGLEQLQAMGRVRGRALDYGTAYALDWSQVLDGVVVLSTETAAAATH